jgi:DNA-binding transcriptional LysR family regulator
MSAQIRSNAPPAAQLARAALGNDWSDIHFAFQVARLGTLSAAATQLDVHHSTVLRRIDALEQRLDTRLFHRHARGYTTTDAGKILLQVASRTQDEFDRMIGQLAGADDQLTGTLVVTTVNSYAAQLTPVLARFQQLHPEIRIDYVADSRIFKLEYAEAHLSIRPGARPKDPDYVVQHLRTMPTTFYASPKYIRQHGRMKKPTDIEGHRFISTIAPMANIAHIAWMKKHIPENQIYYRASDFITMMHAAASGLGIAPVNCWQGESDKAIVPLFKPPKEWDSNLWLVTHRDIHRTPKVQALCQFLKEQLSDTSLGTPSGLMLRNSA